MLLASTGIVFALLVALSMPIVFALGIAGFAGIIAMAPMHAAVLAVSGVLFAVFGLSGRRRAIVPPRGPGNDMRDFV